VRLTIALQRKDAKFNIAEAEISQEESEIFYGIWSSPHPLDAQVSIYVCSNAAERPVCGVLKCHELPNKSRFFGKLIDREVNHYSSANVQYAKKLSKIREANIHTVKMLENVSRKNSADGAVALRQVQAVDNRKLHIYVRHRFSRAINHVFGHIHGTNVLKRSRKLLRKPPCTTSDLQATSFIESILLPMTQEVAPIGLSKSIELFLCPRRVASLLFACPGSNSPKWIIFPPQFPFSV